MGTSLSGEAGWAGVGVLPLQCDRGPRPTIRTLAGFIRSPHGVRRLGECSLARFRNSSAPPETILGPRPFASLRIALAAAGCLPRSSSACRWEDSYLERLIVEFVCRDCEATSESVRKQVCGAQLRRVSSECPFTQSVKSPFHALTFGAFCKQIGALG